jgi:hypothetical protein
VIGVQSECWEKASRRALKKTAANGRLQSRTPLSFGAGFEPRRGFEAIERIGVFDPVPLDRLRVPVGKLDGEPSCNSKACRFDGCERANPLRLFTGAYRPGTADPPAGLPPLGGVVLQGVGEFLRRGYRLRFLSFCGFRLADGGRFWPVSNRDRRLIKARRFCGWPLRNSFSQPASANRAPEKKQEFASSLAWAAEASFRSEPFTPRGAVL